MKNFFKKLAFVLALALVVTAIAPAAKASAAAAPALNVTGKKIYIGGDVTGDYSDTFTLSVKNLGTYKVTFASADKSIATVSAKGKVTAVAVGNTTITATVTNPTTKKVVKKLTSKVWVKKNATEVGFSAASKAKFDKALVVGDSAKLNVYRKDTTGKLVWKQADKTVVTDYIKWTSSDPSVAKVTKWGTVVAVAPGEATITAVAKQTEGYTSTTEPATVKVVVNAKGITEVDQTAYNEIEVTFGTAQDTTAVTKDTLTITPADSSVAIPVVKTVEFNDAKTVATVTTYSSLDDKAAYTVAVTDTDMVGEFIASVGDVAKITITDPAKVIENTLTEIEYELTDANGVIVPADSDSRVEFSVSDNDTKGYIGTTENDDDETVDAVNVYEEGDTVALKAVYYTGDYDTDGNEVSYTSNAFVVTAIDPTDATLATTKYTITNTDDDDADADDIDWDDFDQNLQVEIGNYDYFIEAYVKDSTGTEYYTDDDVADYFEFDSQDETKLTVGDDGRLTPIAKGTAYVKVTVTSTDKSFLVKVTVAAEADTASFVFDTYTETVSTAGSLVDDIAEFNATVKDQYGNTMGSSKYNLGDTDDAKITLVSNTTDASDADVLAALEVYDYNTLQFDPEDIDNEAGTVTFKVVVDDDFARTIKVVIKAPTTSTAADTNKLVLSTTSLDMAINNDNDTEKTVEVGYYVYASNNVKRSKIDLSAYTVTLTSPDGVVVTGSAISGGSIEYVFNSDADTSTGSALTKVLSGDTGTYKLVVKNGSTTVKTTTFTVKDTQVAPTVTCDDNTVYHSDDILDAFSTSTKNDSEGVEITGFSYKISGGDGTVYTSVGTALPSDDKIIVYKVFVTETFDSDNFFVHKITVNKTLYIND